MNILKYSKEEILRRVNEGEMRKENLKHYDICKELEKGGTAVAIAEKFNMSEERSIRYIKKKKCPDCGRTKIH